MKIPNLLIMSVERKEIQTKGIDNLFNRRIAENIFNLEKERITQVQETYRASNHQDKKETPPYTS
jgi:hypothetical protein